MSDASERLFGKFLEADKVTRDTGRKRRDALAAYDRYADQCRADDADYHLDLCREEYRKWLMTVGG